LLNQWRRLTRARTIQNQPDQPGWKGPALAINFTLNNYLVWILQVHSADSYSGWAGVKFPPEKIDIHLPLRVLTH